MIGWPPRRIQSCSSLDLAWTQIRLCIGPDDGFVGEPAFPSIGQRVDAGDGGDRRGFIAGQWTQVAIAGGIGQLIKSHPLGAHDTDECGGGGVAGCWLFGA